MQKSVPNPTSVKARLRPLNEKLWEEAVRESDLAMEGKAPSYVRVTLPYPVDRNEVRATRKALAATQRAFAEIVGVSLETVKAWEAGKRIPEGPASKLIRLLKQDHTLALTLADV